MRERGREGRGRGEGGGRGEREGGRGENRGKQVSTTESAMPNFIQHITSGAALVAQLVERSV